MNADEDVAFDRTAPCGYFWMVWEDFVEHFTKLYVCKANVEAVAYQNAVVVKTSDNTLKTRNALQKHRDGGVALFELTNSFGQQCEDFRSP